jgi:hypothetical protein
MSNWISVRADKKLPEVEAILASFGFIDRSRTGLNRSMAWLWINSEQRYFYYSIEGNPFRKDIITTPEALAEVLTLHSLGAL